MTGIELKELIELSDYTITALAQRWKMSREWLQRQLNRRDTLERRYELLAQEAGLLDLKKIKAPVASEIAKETERLRHQVIILQDQLAECKRQNRKLREKNAELRKPQNRTQESIQPNKIK